MEAKATWKDGLLFNGTSMSGFTLDMDAAVESGGKNEGFRPMELLLIGLAGCTGMDVISILQKKKQTIRGFEVRVQADRAVDHPRVFTKIVIEYIITGHEIQPAAVARAIELSETKYCSAQAILSKAARIEHKISITEV